MVIYRQVLLASDSIYNLKASNKTSKKKRTQIKLADANLIQVSFYMESSYIAESVEYALDPFETYPNSSMVSANFFEDNLYNFSAKSYLQVQNLSTFFRCLSLSI